MCWNSLHPCNTCLNMTFLEFEHLRTVSGASTSDVRIGRPWHGVSADATWPQSERTCGDVAQVWQKAGPKGKSAKSASEAEATFSNIQQLQWFLDYFQPQRVQNEASCLDYAWFFRQIGIAFCLITRMIRLLRMLRIPCERWMLPDEQVAMLKQTRSKLPQHASTNGGCWAVARENYPYGFDWFRPLDRDMSQMIGNGSGTHRIS